MDIAYPKLWVPYEILTAQALNDEFGAVAAVVNGKLEDSNISAGAQIRGYKIANFPNGIDNPQLNDKCISKRNLQPGIIDSTVLSTNSVGSDQIVNGSILNEDIHDGTIQKQKLYPGASTWDMQWSIGGVSGIGGPAGEVVIAETTFTSRGSIFMVLAVANGDAFTQVLGQSQFRFRLLLNSSAPGVPDGSELNRMTTSLHLTGIPTGGSGNQILDVPVSVSLLARSGIQAVGVHRVQLTAQMLINDAGVAVNFDHPTILAWEPA